MSAREDLAALRVESERLADAAARVDVTVNATAGDVEINVRSGELGETVHSVIVLPESAALRLARALSYVVGGSAVSVSGEGGELRREDLPQPDVQRAACEFRYVLDGMWNGTLGDDADRDAIDHLRAGLSALGETWRPEAPPDEGGPAHPAPCE